MKPILPSLAAFLLSGCATLSSGAFQTVTILSEPAGAACTVSRDGEIIGAVAATPGPVRIRRSVRDAEIRCVLPGHAPGSATLTARFQTGQAIGNIVTVGMGLLVDARSGALGRYPAYAQVTLQPLPAPLAQQAEPPAPAPNAEAVARRRPAACDPERDEDCEGAPSATAELAAFAAGTVKHKQLPAAPPQAALRSGVARTAEASAPQPANSR